MFSAMGPEKHLKQSDFLNSVLLNLALLMLPMHKSSDLTHLVSSIGIKYLHFGVIGFPSMNVELLPGAIQPLGGLICHLEVSHY